MPSDQESPKCPLCSRPLMRDPATKEGHRKAVWDCERCWVSFTNTELSIATATAEARKARGEGA